MRLGNLPGGLADPLHYQNPFPWTLFKVLAALAVGILVITLLRWWLGRRQQAPSRPLPAPLPSRPMSLVASIEEIRRRYRESRDYRQACHELSTLLRWAFESATRRRYSTLTAGEIRRQLGESRIARFFSFLGELQFGRRAPSGNDVEGACDLAIDVARKELS